MAKVTIKTRGATTLNIMAEHCYAECHYAECRYAECHYAECRGSLLMFIPRHQTTVQDCKPIHLSIKMRGFAAPTKYQKY